MSFDLSTTSTTQQYNSERQVNACMPSSYQDAYQINLYMTPTHTHQLLFNFKFHAKKCFCLVSFFSHLISFTFYFLLLTIIIIHHFFFPTLLQQHHVNYQQKKTNKKKTCGYLFKVMYSNIDCFSLVS